MNTPATLTASATVNPPQPNWRRAFGGVWRLTYRRFLAPTNLWVVAGLLAFLALLTVTTIRTGSSAQFTECSVYFYLAFLVPVFAFFSAAGLINDDLKAATSDYVLTRPVRRHAFVIHRYIAHVACLQVQCLCTLAVLVAVGVFRQIPELENIVPSLLLAQTLAVPAFCAMGFAFGAFSNHYLILGLFYGGIIEGGIGNIPTRINSISMLHQVRSIANGVLPLRGKAAQYVESFPTAVTTLLVASVVFLAIAAALFSLRETAGIKPKDA